MAYSAYSYTAILLINGYKTILLNRFHAINQLYWVDTANSPHSCVSSVVTLYYEQDLQNARCIHNGIIIVVGTRKVSMNSTCFNSVKWLKQMDFLGSGKDLVIWLPTRHCTNQIQDGSFYVHTFANSNYAICSRISYRVYNFTGNGSKTPPNSIFDKFFANAQSRTTGK